MELQTTHRIPDALLQAQLRQHASITKKTLWETEIISQDDTAYLLGISKETLRNRAMIYKAIRVGNNYYYSTSMLKEALLQEAMQKINLNSTDTDREFANLFNTKKR